MATKPTVEALRQQIAVTRAELDAIARAPIPVAEAEENMGRLLDAAAARYLPSVELFARDPDPQLDALSLVMPDARYDAAATWCFLAAVVDRPRLVAVWSERLRAAYETDVTLGGAIPLGERPARLQALRTRLHELELAEEQLIVDLESRGVQVDRREDANPAVLFADEILAHEASPP